MLSYLLQSWRAVPGLVGLWVNKLIGLFANSPRIALRDWRPDADHTAAALGTVVVIVLAVGLPLIPPKPVRIGLAMGLAILFLILTGVGVWQCYSFFHYLDSVSMSKADARDLQAVWERWYIVMLIAFVATVTCALAAGVEPVAKPPTHQPPARTTP
jgi:hypothetical protein